MIDILKISAAGCVVLFLMVLLTAETFHRTERASMAQETHIQSWAYPDYLPPTPKG